MRRRTEGLRVEARFPGLTEQSKATRMLVGWAETAFAPATERRLPGCGSLAKADSSILGLPLALARDFGESVR